MNILKLTLFHGIAIAEDCLVCWRWCLKRKLSCVHGLGVVLDVVADEGADEEVAVIVTLDMKRRGRVGERKMRMSGTLERKAEHSMKQYLTNAKVHENTCTCTCVTGMFAHNHIRTYAQAQTHRVTVTDTQTHVHQCMYTNTHNIDCMAN